MGIVYIDGDMFIDFSNGSHKSRSGTVLQEGCLRHEDNAKINHCIGDTVVS